MSERQSHGGIRPVRIAQKPSAYMQMTVEEANQITRNYQAGALDPRIPGTMEVVYEAHRVQVNAYMWGAMAGRPQTQRRRRLVLACCAIAAATSTGLTMVFLASH